MEKGYYTLCEYIWIGGNGELRSKTRVLRNLFSKSDIRNIPEWNYDGSSTNQAPSDGNTEVILKPCAIYKDPLRLINDCECFLVLCETYDNDGIPLPTNYRNSAYKVFEKGVEMVPWYGLEQEYFIKFDNFDYNIVNNGTHYCGSANNLERTIVEEHLAMCLFVGLEISGINAEVATGQWEFQIGPSEGINAADQMWVARYLLQRVAEKYNATIDYSPKISETANGSGCHINFSTTSTRVKNGMNSINSYIEKLNKNHKQHISLYGENNHLRLTGKHETSDINNFSWGIGTRNTSIRIPNQTFKDSCGYFEDRRPASNIDPYQATSIIFKTCCLDSLHNK